MIASSRSCQSEVPFRLNVGRIRHSIERSFSFSFLSTPGSRRDTLSRSKGQGCSSASRRAPLRLPTAQQNLPRLLRRQPFIVHWQLRQRQRQLHRVPNQYAGTPGDNTRRCAAQLRLRLRLPSLSPANDPGALRGPARPAVQSRRVDARHATLAKRERDRRRRLHRRRGLRRRRARPDAPLCLAADRARRPAHGRPRSGTAVRARDRAQ